MIATDKHASKELEIFKRFVEVCNLPIQPDSIEHRDPPAPDILCTVEGEGLVAFEMVELVPEEFAQRTSDRVTLRNYFKDAFLGLPAAAQSEIKACFGNVLILVHFDQKTSLHVRQNAIRKILEKLHQMSRSLTRKKPSTRDLENSLRKLVGAVTIMIGDYDGPILHESSATKFVDPTLKRVHQKFKKQYLTSTPIELLAYYDLHPIPPESHWVPELYAFLTGNLRNSDFRRVWVYDLRDHSIKFVYPRN